MSLEENKTVTRRYNEDIWGQGNLAVVDEIVSPSFFEHNSDMQSPNEMKKRAANIHKTNSDVHIIVEEQIAEGDRVMNRVVGEGIYKGGGDMPDTAIGKKWTVELVDIFRVMDGKITEARQVRGSFSIDT